NSICNSADILERRNLPLLAKTVLALNKFSPLNVIGRTITTTTATATTTTSTTTKTTTKATATATQTNV
ncbi:hypothetical protein LOAG_15158, partial [Loa loa]